VASNRRNVVSELIINLHIRSGGDNKLFAQLGQDCIGVDRVRTGMAWSCGIENSTAQACRPINRRQGSLDKRVYFLPAFTVKPATDQVNGAPCHLQKVAQVVRYFQGSDTHTRKTDDFVFAHRQRTFDHSH
jgi:hypothetical protein